MSWLFKNKKKEPEENILIILHLNARLMPMDRGEIFEDNIDDVLQQNGWGEVCGGGTWQNPDGEISGCVVEMDVNRDSVDKTVEFLCSIGIIPQDSHIEIGDKKINAGMLEGLGLYLNGTELAEEVYKNCDINFMVEELHQCLEGRRRLFSYWQGLKETALYFYGENFEEMKAAITDFTASYPLCEKCRVVKIA